jgi:predicted dienelactone hydrolase
MFSFNPAYRRKALHIAVILCLLVGVGLIAVPHLSPIVSSAAMQRAGRGVLRGRIQQRLEQKKAEAKETKAQNERPPTETRQIAGMPVAIWKPAQRGRSPLLVFSHGLNGCNTQSTYFMQAFADAGYLVVAPNHNDAACGKGGRGAPSRPEEKLGRPGDGNENTYRERGDDIRNLLDALRRDSLNSQVDWNRVGLVGHSLGGYTMIGAAGGWTSWRRAPDIKAILAWSPWCEPYAINGNLRLGVPIMYQGGTRDLGVTPSIRKSDGCFAKTSGPAIFVEFNGAGHFAWTDVQDTAQDLITEYSLEFLDRYVRNDNRASPTERVAGVSDLRVK